MRIVVCVRQGTDGEICPFDGCAYEQALQIPGAEVILLSMCPAAAEPFLVRLTRLGAARAIMLTDSAFAGADTLATAYTLSLAIKRLSPNYVFCGRQTTLGDTGQTAIMTAKMLDIPAVTNVMSMSVSGDKLCGETRFDGAFSVDSPALFTFERINTLRLPSIRSKAGEVERWSAADIGADAKKAGLAGSPTRVIESKQNDSSRRRCKFVDVGEIDSIIQNATGKKGVKIAQNGTKMTQKVVVLVTDSSLEYAKMITDEYTVIEMDTAENIAKYIRENDPDVVLWGSDSTSKRRSAEVAAMLNLGLCADCTSLEYDGERFYMIRPALSGSVTAKIISTTRPAMATVRTVQNDAKDVFVCMGYGARNEGDAIRRFAERYGADVSCTRKIVDADIMDYSAQVGLTGRTVAPRVYIALGVSGAVHHIVGMDRSGTVIAVNNDKNAPIFDYADYGVVADVEQLLNK